MIRVYRSDTWDSGNHLTHFAEYHHPCFRCGEDVTTYDYYDESQLCISCEEWLYNAKNFSEWLQSQIDRDPVFWFRFFNQYYAYLYIYFYSQIEQ